MRILLSLLIGCILVIQPLAAQQLSQNEQSLIESNSYYYLYRDNSKVDGFLQWLQDSKKLDQSHRVQNYPVGFLAVVFAENPNQLQGWILNHTFTGNIKETIEKALWLSGNSKMITALFGEIPGYTRSTAPSLLSLKLTRAEDLDMMWGAFSASGNVAYVNKVIDVLDDKFPLTGDESMDKLTRDAAAWSLGSNMRQHELVDRLIHKELTVRSDLVKKKLQTIVERYGKRNPFPNQDGEFSAILIITNNKNLEEHTKPSTDVIKVKEISEIKAGDDLAIKIAFTGMQLTDDLKADVTFDLQIISPNGKIIEGADFKNLEALKTRVPSRFRIFDNKNFIMIGFDSMDELGTYKILANVYDNIGNKKILLMKEIKFVN